MVNKGICVPPFKMVYYKLKSYSIICKQRDNLKTTEVDLKNRPKDHDRRETASCVYLSPHLGSYEGSLKGIVRDVHGS